MRAGILSVILILLTDLSAAAQVVADTSPFRPLDLPAPNAYRSASGRPGPQYWQQQVDYTIQATLNANRKITATETIRYKNNSPDTLTYLWFHLDQNICAPGSISGKLNQPPLVFQQTTFDFSCKGLPEINNSTVEAMTGPRPAPGGFTISAVGIDGRPAVHVIDGTVMRVDLPRPLSPGGSTTISVGWAFNVPAYGAGRMGADGPLLEVAQWYPRLAVYDDVRGWNHEPYIGAGEFYLEYGDFDVTLEVAREYIVAATGQLMNPEYVLTPTQYNRYRAARASAEPIAIIAADEVGRPESRPAAPGWSHVWRFRAENVRDFAFAVSTNWRWDASGFDGILINTLYRSSAPLWTEANRMAHWAIRHFSTKWFRYPYPHATTVEGPIEGMEYPMLTFVPRGSSREDLHWVLMHEFGHQWFPMIVGSNERLYPWMDEGFNSFIDIAAAVEYFKGTAWGSPYGDTVHLTNLHLYPAHSKPGEEQPLINRPIEVRDLFWGGYRKPALMLQLLREEVLGPEKFDFAFREYTRAWAFKHPTPADFFRIMRDASGVELDWFWRGWVYTTARLDQAIDRIEPREGGGSNVQLSNRGQMLMPAELRVTFADNSTETVRLPVDLWNLGTRFTYRVPGDRRVTRAELDPRGVYPDIDRSNNRWPR